MKHIKYFTESISNEYYHTVEYDEYEKDMFSIGPSSIKSTIFQPRYLNEIVSRLKDNFTIIESDDNGIVLSGGRWKRYDIFQCYDEWFYVTHEVQDINTSPYNRSYIYFKCDQFDGLMKFLKDHEIIN